MNKVNTTTIISATAARRDNENTFPMRIGVNRSILRRISSDDIPVYASHSASLIPARTRAADKSASGDNTPSSSSIFCASSALLHRYGSSK